MDHNKRLNGDEKIVMTIEEDDYTAFCSPQCDGSIFVDGEQIGKIPAADFEDSPAPFRVDVDFDERHPTKGEVRAMLPAILSEFSEQFDSRVDAVYNLIEESDDPLDEILELDEEDLSP